MRILHFIFVLFALLSDAFANQRVLEGPVAVAGEPAESWDGPWTVYEPSKGVLDVELQATSNGEGGDLAIHVASNGDSETGMIENSAALFRALGPQLAGSAYTVRFSIWFNDAGQFSKRESLFGIMSTDLSDLAALSSRSAWNIICYAAATTIGEVELQAGEIALRAMPADGGALATISTGIIMETLTPVKVVITVHTTSATFDVRIDKEGQVFESSGLGYWAQKPDFEPRYLNLYFSTTPWDGFSIFLNDLSISAVQ